jgi:ABC-2 type transport system ATP-binding protein
MLAIEGVAKSYGDTLALDSLDLTVEPGEILGLLGPNGAGKTTLAQIVTSLVRPDAGHVRIGGFDVFKQKRSARSLVGYAPQELGLYSPLTARANLEFFGSLAGLRNKDLRDAVERVSAAVELHAFMDAKIQTLSGGQKRRVHVACALIGDPPLLLLDEPTAGVDIGTRKAMVESVRELAGRGIAVCYCTHYIPEVESLKCGVAILHRGRLLARSSVENLVASEGHASIELVFGDDFEIALDFPNATRNGRTITVATNDPEGLLPHILNNVTSRNKLKAVNIVRPSLEEVFLDLTGTRSFEHSENQPEFQI